MVAKIKASGDGGWSGVWTMYVLTDGVRGGEAVKGGPGGTEGPPRPRCDVSVAGRPVSVSGIHSTSPPPVAFCRASVRETAAEHSSRDWGRG